MKTIKYTGFDALIRKAAEKYGMNAYAYCTQGAVVSFADFYADASRVAAAIAGYGCGAAVLARTCDTYAFLTIAAGTMLADCVLFSAPDHTQEYALDHVSVVIAEKKNGNGTALTIANGIELFVSDCHGSDEKQKYEQAPGLLLNRGKATVPAFIPLCRMIPLLGTVPVLPGNARLQHSFSVQTVTGLLFSLLLPLWSGCCVFCGRSAMPDPDEMRSFAPEILYLSSEAAGSVYRSFMRMHETSAWRVTFAESAETYFGGSLRSIFCLNAASDAPLLQGFRAAGVCADGFTLYETSKKAPTGDILSVPFSRSKTMEQKRVEIAVRETLGADTVNLYSDFFSCGGSAYTAFALAVRLGIRFQTVYEHPVLFDLARNIHDQQLPQLGIRGRFNELLNSMPPCSDPLPEGAVLLTGATGFLGIHLLRYLIENGRRVYCLVRSKKRLQTAMRDYLGFGRHDLVIPLDGDVTLTDLGIANSQRRRLFSEIGVVIHAAANVKPFGALRDYEAVNVTGTQNVLDLAKRIGAAVALISDIGICGVGREPADRDSADFNERSFDVGQKLIDIPYLQSKRCAEALALDAMKNGMDVTVFRPGPLSWRLSDGKFRADPQHATLVCCLRAIARAGIYHPDLELLLPSLLPVDVCAAQCVSLLFNATRKRVWHIEAQRITVREFFKKAGIVLKPVSACEMEAFFNANAEDPEIGLLRLLLCFARQARCVQVRAADTKLALAQLGITETVLPAQYFSGYNTEDHNILFSSLYNKNLAQGIFNGRLTSAAMQWLYGALNEEMPHPRYLHGKDALCGLQAMLREAGIEKPFFLLPQSLPPAMCAWLAEWETENELFCEVCADDSRETLLSVQTQLLLSGADGIVAVGDARVMSVAKMAAFLIRGNALSLSDGYTYRGGAVSVLPWIAVPTGLFDGDAVLFQAEITDVHKKESSRLVCASLLPYALISDPGLLEATSDSLSSADALRFICCAVESESCSLKRGFAVDRDYAKKTAAAVMQALSSGVCTSEKQREIALWSGMSVRRTGEGYVTAFARALHTHLGCSAQQSLNAVFLPVLSALEPFIRFALSQLAVSAGLASPENDEQINAAALLQVLRSCVSETGLDDFNATVDEETAKKITRSIQDRIAVSASPVFFKDAEILTLVKQILS